LAIRVCSRLFPDSIGYIQALASPLADLDISPIYLSTYASDIILVQSHELEEAWKCLDNVVGSEGSRQWEAILEQFRSNNDEAPSPSNCSMAVSLVSETLSMFTLPVSQVGGCMTELLSLFLYPEERSKQFFSYTITEDEISIIVNSHLVDSLRERLPEGVAFNSELWSGIQINEGSSFGGIPQVCAVARAFARESISLYYLSTFENDYTLVPTNQFRTAVSVLQEKLNALVDH